jgi:hypothetical protein
LGATVIARLIRPCPSTLALPRSSPQLAAGLFLADRVLAVALLSIGWRSFFQIQDQRQNSAYHKHDRDQQHRRLPGSQLLNVSGPAPLQHNLSAQVRLCVSRERFRRNKACVGPRLIDRLIGLGGDRDRDHRRLSRAEPSSPHCWRRSSAHHRSRE